MSGSVADGVEAGGFAQLTTTPPGSALMNILMAEEILPGSLPSYQLCKEIYVSHPLGGKMAENPINMAQSQEREISVPGAPESLLIPAFKREWARLGVVGADSLAKNVMTLARVYGIASLAVGDINGNPAEPIGNDALADHEIYFNIFDPLNTAGSLTLEQDPQKPTFMKPGDVRVGSQTWHRSRVCVVMNEQPIYIQWSNSAYGFTGRSIYQRPLFPLKTFIQSMFTDQMVTQKCGLLIAKMKGNSSTVNNRMAQFFGFKRSQLKAGSTGQVLSIGHDEDIQSLNFQNLEGAARFARDNCLKNVASAGGMPARMLDQETLVSGFGEGAEDAKQIARYIDRVRIEMNPVYHFLDNIVMRRAWSRQFYETVQSKEKRYRRVPYETAFYEWSNAFAAIWPNLLTEPDSEKAQAEKAKFETVIAYVAAMAPLMDPANKAELAVWAADQTSDAKMLFSGPLMLDEEALRSYVPPAAEFEPSAERESRVMPFSGRS